MTYQIPDTRYNSLILVYGLRITHRYLILINLINLINTSFDTLSDPIHSINCIVFNTSILMLRYIPTSLDTSLEPSIHRLIWYIDTSIHHISPYIMITSTSSHRIISNRIENIRHRIHREIHRSICRYIARYKMRQTYITKSISIVRPPARLAKACLGPEVSEIWYLFMFKVAKAWRLGLKP